MIKKDTTMKKKAFLINLLNSFVDIYNRYLLRTYGLTVAFSVVLFIVIALLFKFSDFEVLSTKKQISLLSFFFTKYSNGWTYSLVDLSKNIFIFFVSIFSISMIRMNNSQKDADEIKLRKLTNHFHFIDMINLIGVLIFCSIIDYLLFKLDTYSKNAINNQSINTWVHNIDLYILRVYIPLILFSLIIHKITIDNKVKITFKSICYIFISLWMMNEFMYEFVLFIRIYLFGIILAPFNPDNKFIYESIFSIFLIALTFLGYYSAMTKPLILLNDNIE
jgi:hypothetical protein